MHPPAIYPQTAKARMIRSFSLHEPSEEAQQTIESILVEHPNPSKKFAMMQQGSVQPMNLSSFDPKVRALFEVQIEELAAKLAAAQMKATSEKAGKIIYQLRNVVICLQIFCRII
jgi:hypothetical protein